MGKGNVSRKENIYKSVEGKDYELYWETIQGICKRTVENEKENCDMWSSTMKEMVRNLLNRHGAVVKDILNKEKT